MMAAGILLALLSPAVAAEPMPEEIIVLGRRLEQVGVRMNIDRRGRLRSCQVSRSVGDAALDRFWCEAAAACAGGGPTSAAQLRACAEARKDEFLERLVAMRSAARDRNGAHAHN